MRYILAVAAGDSSRTVRRHVARNACQSLALLLSMGELKTSVKESESLLIEEDGSAQDKAKETKKSEVDSLVRTLRKDKEVGKNEMIREFLVPIALYVTLFQYFYCYFYSYNSVQPISTRMYGGLSLNWQMSLFVVLKRLLQSSLFIYLPLHPSPRYPLFSLLLSSPPRRSRRESSNPVAQGIRLCLPQSHQRSVSFLLHMRRSPVHLLSILQSPGSLPLLNKGPYSRPLPERS
jgi:hypothetical protein